MKVAEVIDYENSLDSEKQPVIETIVNKQIKEKNMAGKKKALSFDMNIKRDGNYSSLP